MMLHPMALLSAFALLATGEVTADTADKQFKTGPSAAMQSINPLRLAKRQTDNFVLPDGETAHAARSVFSMLVENRLPDAVALRAAGLEAHGGADWQAVADRADDPAGRGLYVFRSGGLPLLISAPHQFRDLRTGRIAGLMFDELGFAAAAFNTTPRDLPLAGGASLSDLSKLEGTHFNLFHLAYHATYPGGRIVQLHGFARDRRRSAAGRATDVIVSNGTRRLDPATGEVVACLKRAGFVARRYPDEVEELGGTTNITLAELIGAGAPAGSFVHVETSRELRDKLSEDPAMRFVFGTCLGAGF